MLSIFSFLMSCIALGSAVYTLLFYVNKYLKLLEQYNKLEERNTELEQQPKIVSNEGWFSTRCKELQLRNDELIKILKAILYNSDKHEIRIDGRHLEERIDGEIYIENDFMSFDKILKLLPNATRL